MKLEGRIVDSRLSWLIIALVATLPYAGVLRAPFVFDDVKLVKENELLRVESGEAVDRFLPTFAIASREWDSDELRENYRPLRFFSYYLDYQLSRFVWGEFPADEPPTLIFHVQNLAWHLANALLVLFLGRRLLGSRRAGFILAVLFALHPLQTEAVTYVSGRRDVLSTFFFLAALALYLRSPAEKPLRWSVLATSPLAFACGFFSKEMVVTLPAVVLLVDWYRRPLWEPRRVALHALLWLVALAFAGITLANESLRAEPLVASELTSRFLMPARYALRYLFLVLLPVSQSLDYSYDAIAASRGLFDPWTTFASLLGVALLAATALWGFVRRRAAVALGISWFLVTLTPVLQFVPIAERFAERFAYLPSIGILLVVSSALATLWKARAPLGRGLVGALALTLFLATVLRNGDWTSELAIWEAATRAQPRAARSHLALGNALRAERRYAEAGEAYSVALEIWATNPEPSSLQRGQALRARMHRGGVYAL
ncbi:MAG: hypothetical protein O7J95_00715, partial [Planctomycetota bacterium]|nr:hypothetical protein [Planctomycetota bacterium]